MQGHPSPHLRNWRDLAITILTMDYSAVQSAESQLSYTELCHRRKNSSHPGHFSLIQLISDRSALMLAYDVFPSFSKEFSSVCILPVLKLVLSRVWVTIDESGLVTGFTARFNTLLVTTSNYNSLTGFHALKITVTVAYIKSSQSACTNLSW
jgi:hypothetical protein